MIGIVILSCVIIGGLFLGFWTMADLSPVVLAAMMTGITTLIVLLFKDKSEEDKIPEAKEFAELEIIHNPNDPDQYCFFGQDDDKKYLTVCVENNGNGKARKCKARLKITRKQNTRYPSGEWKFLRWAYENTEKITINAKDKEFLNVAFSVEKSVYNTSAFIANTNSINFPEKPRIKDGCPEGEYEFTILINAEKGEQVQRRFKMTVAKDWKDLSMSTL